MAEPVPSRLMAGTQGSKATTAHNAGPTLNTYKDLNAQTYWEGFSLTGLAGSPCKHRRIHCLLLQWHFTGRG